MCCAGCYNICGQMKGDLVLNKIAGMLRSNLNNQVLNIPGASKTPGTPITLYKEHGGPNQKWKIIPAAAWEDYETLMNNPTPLTRATFWRMVVAKHFDVVTGSDAKEFKQKITNCRDLLKNSAEQLEKVNTDTGTKAFLL